MSAPSLSINESYDASWQAEHLNNWSQEYDQISAGRFHGQLKQINFDKLDISREFASQALRQSCLVKHSGFWLGFSQGLEPSKMNGVKSNNRSLFWHAGGQEFELITPKETVIYSILLDSNLLTDYLSWQDLTAEQVFCRLPQHKINALLFLLNRLLNPNTQNWSAQSQQKIINDAVIELVSFNSDKLAGKPSFKQRQLVVQKVRDYIYKQVNLEPITIDDLCKVAHVSRRTLQYSFNDLLGISPKQFIKAVRLNQIRRCLLNHEDDRNIYQIAFDFGYFHLGQFSQDYKKMFAETASETRLLHL